MIITYEMLFNNTKDPMERYAFIVKEAIKEIPPEGNFNLKFYFDYNIKNSFINPLFLITLLNLFEKIKKNKKQLIMISLNINLLPKNVQHQILTFLTQYIDCAVIEIIYINQQKIDSSSNVRTSTEKMVIYCSIQENCTTLLGENKSYNFFPIIKISNNLFMEEDKFIEKNYFLVEKKDGNNYDKKIVSNFNRKIIYKSLLLETIDMGVYRRKSKKVWTDIFEIYLGVTGDLFIFKDIFLELVENIQKHTKNANGYISFYKNISYTTHNQFELMIADDYSEGFLNTYLSSMKNELESEDNAIAIEGYKEIIYDIESGKYKETLESIFNLDYILSAQKVRIVKHFGWPLLLKTIVKLEKKSVDKYNENFISLKIYLNKDEKSFLITFNEGKAYVKQLKDNTVRGTYVYFCFPEKLTDILIEKDKVSFNTKSTHYKNYFRNRKIIENQLSKIQYYFNFDDLRNKKRPENHIESIVIDYRDIENRSDFLRYLYSFAFMHSLKDIIVINYPIEENLNYLLLFCESFDISTITNIIFLDYCYPQILFIGGESYENFLRINHNIAQIYNYNKRSFLANSSTINDITFIDSNLFYNEDGFQKIIPLELFLYNPNKKDEYLYTNMLENFLESKNNFEDIHLDLKNRFHINKFYYLKHIFENSQWIKLLAFNFARIIELEYNNIRDIIFVAIERYTSVFLTEVEYILDEKLQIYNILEEKNDELIKQFHNFCNMNKDKYFIFIKSSVFGSTINFITKEVNNYKKYCLIQLISNENINKWHSLYQKDITNLIELSSKCKHCFVKNVPLYEQDKNKYNIKNFAYNSLKNYRANSTYSHVCWDNSIYLSHIKKDNGHYLYYIRTSYFINNNKFLIADYLNSINIKNTNCVPVLLTSNNISDSEFTLLINKEVFNNDALIYYIDFTNYEQLTILINDFNENLDNFDFYLVDEFITGEVLKNIYSVFDMFNLKKIKAVFSIFDNLYSIDKVFLEKNHNEFYAFQKIYYYPTNDTLKECLICQRKDFFNYVSRQSSLVYTKYIFSKKVKFLELKNYKEIEHEILPQIVNLKNYLGMSSIEYIYKNIDNLLSKDSIDLEINLYYNEVKTYFSAFYLNSATISEEIEKILNFETRKAFIKSLISSDRLFFKNARKAIHEYIYNELRMFTDETSSLTIDVMLMEILSPKDFNELEKFESIKQILNYYKVNNFILLDYYKFLLNIGSFLGINHILSYESLVLYYKLIDKLRDNIKCSKILNDYVTVVKELTTQTKEKSKYFNCQLMEFYKSYSLSYTMRDLPLHSLFLENTNFLKLDDNIFNDIKMQTSLNDKLNIFIEGLQNIIFSKVKNIQIDKVCIDISDDNVKPILIDLLDDYSVVYKNSYEYMLHAGTYIKNNKFDDVIDIKKSYLDEKHEELKYHIFSNFYKNFKTYIRITDNNLNSLGVIVIKHLNKNEDSLLLEHLYVSRETLSFQNKIVKLFKKEKMLNDIKIYYNEQIEREIFIFKEREKIYKETISKFNHSTFSNVKIYTRLSNLIEDYDRGNCNIEDLYFRLTEIKDFSIIIENVASLGKYYDENQKVKKVEKYGIEEIFFEGEKDSIFYDRLKRFLLVRKMEPIIKEKRERKITVSKNINEFSKIKIENELIEFIIFEFILNALKHGHLDLDLEIYYKDEKIIIKNRKRDVNFLANKQNAKIESNNIGHKAIQNILKTDNIYMRIDDDDLEYYKIILSKDK